MAPIQPAPHRTAKPSRSILKTSSTTSHTQKPEKTESLFAANKKDKRRIKHAQLISKVTKAQTKQSKRRRPSKKLVTTLDALANALPDGGEDNEEPSANKILEQQVNVIRRTSTKSRPGALKRKQKLDNEERSRFTKNMAQMAVSTSSAEGKGNATNSNSTTAASFTQKLAALRGFISQTLEKKADFRST